MQLDHTHVVIRLRSLSEIGDLTMVMLRRYPTSMLVGFAAGAFPWTLLNGLLIYWIPLREASYGLDDEEAMIEIWRYVSWMVLLVTLQAPAAGVLATLYLGQAVFEQKPTWRSVLREAKRQFWSWFRILAVRRLAIPAMIVLAVRWGQPASVIFDLLLPIAILLAVVAIRGSRPFVPEILLLEQCPIKAASEQAITLGLRSRSLHTPMAGELGGRFLTIGVVLAGLAMCVLYTLMAIRGVLILQWNFLDLTVLLVLFPLSLWIVAGVSVLVRLLGYIDTRIRLEGWEVELAVRAEAMRQFGQGPEPQSISRDHQGGAATVSPASVLENAEAEPITESLRR